MPLKGYRTRSSSRNKKWRRHSERDRIRDGVGSVRIWLGTQGVGLGRCISVQVGKIFDCPSGVGASEWF